MMKYTLALAAFALVGAAAQAQADTYTCAQSTSAGELRAELNATQPSRVDATVYRSTVSLGGKNIPMLGERCFFQDRPSTRFVKCAHQLGDIRIEIYPAVETTSGALKTMQYVIWKGSTPQKGGFSSDACVAKAPTPTPTPSPTPEAAQ